VNRASVYAIVLYTSSVKHTSDGQASNLSYPGSESPMEDLKILNNKREQPESVAHITAVIQTLSI
jgi:hypothetical protein